MYVVIYVPRLPTSRVGGAGAGRETDALRERYQRFSQGDLEGALDLWSDDFIWEGSNASELPGSGAHEGSRRRSRSSSRWDKFELSTDEFIEQGDTVVVLGHTELAKGERPERLPVVRIWRFRLSVPGALRRAM
jgi:ketosteroid isomerase-like protein